MRNAAEGGGGYLSLGLSFVDVAGGEVGCSRNWEVRRGGERLGWGVSNRCSRWGRGCVLCGSGSLRRVDIR